MQFIGTHLSKDPYAEFGMHMNDVKIQFLNIIDEKKILKAHKDPSLYPDLVVRVTGFTAYFSMLSPEFRQLVVDRIIAKE